MQESTDEELAAAVAAGRADALDALYGRYARKLHVFFSTALAVRQPEDLVHDTFVRVIEAVDQFDPRRGPFRAWLFRIARNRATDLLRRSRAVRFESLGVEERDEPGDPDPDVASQAMHRELSAAVRACLDALDNEEERQAFVLYYLADKVLREVGAAFDRSISTAHNWVTAATGKMRDCLRQKGLEP